MKLEQLTKAIKQFMKGKNNSIMTENNNLNALMANRSKGRIHKKIENNIYKTGKHSYRVTLGGQTGLCSTRDAARALKRTFKNNK